MSKLKTHSGSKKRFKVTASGRVKAQAAGKRHHAHPQQHRAFVVAGKRHGMVKRTQKMKRNARGTMVLAPQDGVTILKNFLRNA